MSASPTDVLFRPLRLGELQLSNRIIQGPMAALQPRPDGRPSEQTLAFLAARARGGVGMIIIGGTVGTARGRAEAPFEGLLRMDADEFVEPLRTLTNAVHAHDVPVVAQVFAGFGRMGKSAEDRPLIAASPKNVVMSEDRLPPGLHIPGGRTTEMPLEATIAQIEDIQQQVVAAAVRAQRAGFDGIEIAAHMCYFFSSFLSPRTNWRDDKYGGGAENRARILVDAIRAIRQEVGSDYPIGLRMSVNDHLEDGQDAAGFAEVAAVVARGGLAYIALTDGNYESMDTSVAGPMLEHGEPEVFRKAVGDVPLLIAGVNDPAVAAEAIEAGHVDAVMLARQLLADPEYANKLREGRLEDIVWCDHDNSCLRRLILNVPVRCHLNPRMGRESRDGSLPPISRAIKRPVESVLVGVTGSERLMGAASKLAAHRNKRS